VRVIVAASKHSPRTPKSGDRSPRCRPSSANGSIQFGDGGYLTLYRYDGDLIAILAVRHGREAGYSDPSW